VYLKEYWLANILLLKNTTETLFTDLMSCTNKSIQTNSIKLLLTTKHFRQEGKYQLILKIALLLIKSPIDLEKKTTKSEDGNKKCCRVSFYTQQLTS